VSRRELDTEELVIVLAEDNDDHALLIQMALTRAAPGPVKIHRARNGTEAVEVVREVMPDLLLLDLKMPGMTGHEVLKQIKGDEELRRVPVAVLTSSDRDEDIAGSYGLGGNHFLTKPEDPADLEKRLRALLKNLAEMGGIRRGAGEVRATGVSAVGPDESFRRRVFNWSAVVVLVALLMTFGYCTGALGG
jgi:CheY-like chemotaxis protein